MTLARIEKTSVTVVIAKVYDNGHVKTITNGLIAKPEGLFKVLKEQFATDDQVEELLGLGHIIRSELFDGQPEDFFEAEAIESMERDLNTGTLEVGDWNFLRRSNCYFQVQVANIPAMKYRHAEHILETIFNDVFVFKQGKWEWLRSK